MASMKFSSALFLSVLLLVVGAQIVAGQDTNSTTTDSGDPKADQSFSDDLKALITSVGTFFSKLMKDGKFPDAEFKDVIAKGQALLQTKRVESLIKNISDSVKNVFQSKGFTEFMNNATNMLTQVLGNATNGASNKITARMAESIQSLTGQ